MNRTQLLCVFCKRNELNDTLNKIKLSYDIVFNHIFVLQDKDDLDSLFITFNISDSENYKVLGLNTILLHRKKHTNTLYTINALNAVIKSKTGGNIDPSYQIDWNEFKNSIILCDDLSYKKLHTKIYHIEDL